MRKVLRGLWKVVKWILIVIAALFLLILIIVKVPAVHDLLLEKGTSYFNEKTGGDLSIDAIDLRLPYYVQLEGFSLKTPENEKLASFENLEVSLGWRYLLDQTIRVDKIEFEGLDARVINKDGKAWNYDFIIESFSDTSAIDTSTSSSKWDVSLGSLSLRDINLYYFDGASRDSIDFRLGKLDLSTEEFSVLTNTYLVDELAISDIEALAQLGVSQKTDSASSDQVPANAKAPSDTSSTAPLSIGINEFTFDSSRIDVRMAGKPDRYLAEIGHLILRGDEIDLAEKRYFAEQIGLENSNFEIIQAPTVVDSSAVGTSAKASPSENPAPLDPFLDMEIKLADFYLTGIDFKMETAGKPEETIRLDGFQTKITDIAADSTSYALHLRELRGAYNELNKLETLEAKLKLSKENLDVSKLFLAYGQSKFDSQLQFGFSSLDSLIAGSSLYDAKIQINELRIAPVDVKHFGKAFNIPDSTMIIPEKEIVLKLRAGGNVKNLQIDGLKINTGNTSLFASALAQGSAWNRKDYTLGELDIHLERQDLLAYTAQFGLDTSFIPPVANLRATATYLANRSELDASLTSTYGNMTINGKSGGWADKIMPVDVEVNSRGFNFGDLLGMPVLFRTDYNLKANIENVLDSALTLEASLLIDSLRYDSYMLQNIETNAGLNKDLYTFDVAIQDTFIILDLGGGGQLEPSLTANVQGDLKGIDLKGLGLSQKDIRGRLKFAADYQQDSLYQKGSLSIENILFVKEEERFPIQPLKASGYLSDDSTTARVNSGFFNLSTITNRSIDSLSIAIAELLTNDKEEIKDTSAYWTLDFNTKDLSSVQALFLPGLNEFAPSHANINFDASNGGLTADVDFPRIEYANFEIDSLKIDAVGNNEEQSASLKIKKAAMDTLAIDNLEINSERTEDGANLDFLIRSDTGKINYQIAADLLTKDKALREGFAINIRDSLILNNESWRVDQENDLEYTDEGLIFSNMRFYHDDSEIKVQKQEDDVNIHLDNFTLSSLAGMISTKKPLMLGNLFSDINISSGGATTAKGRIEEFKLAQSNLGKFNYDVKSEGSELSISADGSGGILNFDTKGTLTSADSTTTNIDLDFNLTELKLAGLAELAPAVVNKGEGRLVGNLKISGTTAKPKLNGQFTFEKALLNLAANGSDYSFNNQSINIETKSIGFNRFTVLDSAQNELVINGEITHNYFEDLTADLTINGKDFTLIDLKEGESDMYYGQLIAGADIGVTGKIDQPAIDAQIDISEKTNLSLLLPESEYSDGFDDDLLEWQDFDATSDEVNILTRDKENKDKNTDVYANTIDMKGTVNIDENATFRVVIDSAAGDYLEIKGGGELGLAYDRTGAFRLNGTYKFTDGFYQMTFYNIVKKQFKFQKGSSITWNGGPMNASMNITAVYPIKTNAAPLMQSEGASGSSSALNQKLPFEVLMNIRGELEKPILTFDIRLAEEAKGAMGGAITSRLNQLRKNESQMNKQVFALLVLNTFLGPGGGDANVVAGQARSSASQILTQQLNRLGDNVKGVDINFDLDSYGGAAGEGNTDLSVDLEKSLLNDRVIVRVGSTVALENNQSAGSDSKEMMTNIVIEYKITPDGRYRFKAFRETDFENIVIGRITRSGAGLLFQRDFNRLNRLFDKTKPPQQEEKEEDPPESSNEEATEQKDSEK